jgi:hypothetical protein
LDDVFERLAQDARVNPVRDDLMEVRNDVALVEARELVRRVLHDQLVTQAQLARRTGIKPSAISSFLNDKWAGKVGTLYTTASLLARAVNTLLRQRQAEDTAVGGFVRVRFVERFGQIVQLVIKRKVMGVIVSDAGSGKTVCCEATRDDVAGSVLLTVGKTRSNVKPFLDYFAGALGVDAGGRTDGVQDRIVNRLIGSDRLILVDEAHKLLVPTLDVLREIHDATHCPILMVATPVFRKTVTSSRVGIANRELLDQLSSRIAIFCDLSELAGEDGKSARLHDRDDIRRIFSRGRIRLSRDATDFLARLANTPAAGGLRRCRHLVQVCVDLWPDDEVTAERLRAALAMSIGTREAGFLVSLAGGAEPVEPAAAAA